MFRDRTMTDAFQHDIKQRISAAWAQVAAARSRGDDLSASRYWREFVALIESQMPPAQPHTARTPDDGTPLARAS
jgi:hypothetical protein